MTSSVSKKIGGEYGEVRATIDVEKLNTYLANLNTGTIQTPVTIKQFKVSIANGIGTFADDFQFGQVTNHLVFSHPPH